MVVVYIEVSGRQRQRWQDEFRKHVLLAFGLLT
jgi:hypothetical protein